MWHALAVVLAALLGGIWGVFPTVAVSDVITLLGPHGWGVMLQWVGMFSLAVDVGTLFTLVTVLVAWRGFWFALSLWRVLLSLVPFAG